MPSVLLVEPDQILAKTYKKGLTKAGFEVKLACDSQAAIDSADRLTPDIVVLEVQLIGHSGIEFLYEFRSYPEWQDVPVLILSNVPYGEFKGDIKLLHDTLGVEKYLYKPSTSLQSLITATQELIKVA